MEIVIGLDINEFQAQVSYTEVAQKPLVKTLALSAKGDGMQVETVICKRHGAAQWYYGADAVKKAKNGQGILVENLWRLFLQQETIELEKQSFDTALLCNLFLKRILQAALEKIGGDLGEEVAVKALVVTAEPLPQAAFERMETVLEMLMEDRDRIFVQSYEECLFSYLVHQPERMLGYETGVMDLTNETLVSYRIEMNHRARPIVTLVRRHEMPQIVRKKHYPSIMEHDNALRTLDEQLCVYATEFTRDRLVTTFYLVGDGFEGDWCQESLKVLCRNRKVYAGNNLYSKGAAYSAYERVHMTQVSDQYLFLGRGMLKENIGTVVYNGGKGEYCPLLDAGTSWYEARTEVTLMLERADRITLLITPVNGEKAYEEHISLREFDDREPGTYRIRLALCMENESLLSVSVTDEGFGELFPPSAAVVHKSIRLGGGLDG